MLTHLSANIALCVTEANTLAYYVLTLYCDRGKGLKVTKTDVSLIHRHLKIIDCLTARVFFISTVNDRSKKKKRSLFCAALVART